MMPPLPPPTADAVAVNGVGGTNAAAFRKSAQSRAAARNHSRSDRRAGPCGPVFAAAEVVDAAAPALAIDGVGVTAAGGGDRAGRPPALIAAADVGWGATSVVAEVEAEPVAALAAEAEGAAVAAVALVDEAAALAAVPLNGRLGAPNTA